MGPYTLTHAVEKSVRVTLRGLRKDRVRATHFFVVSLEPCALYQCQPSNNNPWHMSGTVPSAGFSMFESTYKDFELGTVRVTVLSMRKSSRRGEIFPKAQRLVDGRTGIQIQGFLVPKPEETPTTYLQNNASSLSSNARSYHISKHSLSLGSMVDAQKISRLMQRGLPSRQGGRQGGRSGTQDS